jgi:hypothetical protein
LFWKKEAEDIIAASMSPWQSFNPVLSPWATEPNSYWLSHCTGCCKFLLKISLWLPHLDIASGPNLYYGQSQQGQPQARPKPPRSFSSTRHTQVWWDFYHLPAASSACTFRCNATIFLAQTKHGCTQMHTHTCTNALPMTAL